MIDPKNLDDLARRVVENIPPGFKTLQEDLRKNTRVALESAFARLDLVTREEFDVQAAVLARTREKVEQLEQRVAELEAQRHPDGSAEG